MQKEIKLVSCNKNSRYQIRENEQDLYYVRLVSEQATMDGSRGKETERFQYFTEFDWKQFVKNKSLFSFVSEEIVHDPTLPKTAPVAEAPVEDKKGSSFASEFKGKNKQII